MDSVTKVETKEVNVVNEDKSATPALEGKQNEKKSLNKHPNENRELPSYTKGEEIFNAVSHIVGGLLGVCILVLTLIVSIPNGNLMEIFCSIIYGLSAISLYVVSAIYHALPKNKAKVIFRSIDHCSIFFLIAGTYTPICLISMPNLGGYVMFTFVWGFATIGIVLNSINMYSKVVSFFSQLCYIITGWCVILGFGYLYYIWGPYGLIWLASGGIAYTIGAVFYGLGKSKKYFHSIFHVFCVVGTALQFVCILLYVL